MQMLKRWRESVGSFTWDFELLSKDGKEILLHSCYAEPRSGSMELEAASDGEASVISPLIGNPKGNL